ncbi:MAG: single-stranded DNA-binding protein [Burkholderiaceae bacterium]|jgi:single-strand selective monofunctional uracil DNA glycosylase|nr:single-stranded DNA-binding protein [Burkholderiaceae bacterium]
MAFELISAARSLCAALTPLTFAAPVSHVYNPLDYAWKPYELYLARYGNGKKRVLFLGMNPGPFGMVQTGVPFGDVDMARDWLGITAPVHKPARENPKRPIKGFACTRSEVSGNRLWSLMRQHFGTADAFFADAFVVNYCPLAFFDQSRNLTPDKLPAQESAPLYAACDVHLRRVVATLQPQWVIGVGAFAQARAESALAEQRTTVPQLKIGRILHPSPANPAANRGWAQTVTAQLRAAGVWT